MNKTSDRLSSGDLRSEGKTGYSKSVRGLESFPLFLGNERERLAVRSRELQLLVNEPDRLDIL